MSDLVFGRVPYPATQDSWCTDALNCAWDDLGPRSLRGVTWHRMEGTLWGTDGWFKRGCGVSTGLTDYGIGVAAMDGQANAGKILRWNDADGAARPGCSPRRAPWASGPWSAACAFGDGKAFVAEFGVNAINRDRVSIELSGQYGTALDEASRQALCGLTAFYADQARIPYDVFPIWPGHGYSFVAWHCEFCGDPATCAGGQKPCPGGVLRDETDALIARTAAIMEEYQTGGSGSTPPPDSGVSYPEGLDQDLASRWFGEGTAGGKTYRYDEGAPISSLWLTTGAERGQYPALKTVETYDTRTYWRFEGGLTIWRPNDGAPVRTLV